MSTEDLVRLSGVDIRYGKETTAVLRGVNFHLRKGEIVGLHGESGSGKTTLAYVLCGLKHISSGEIRCPFDRVGMVLQNPETALDPMKTVGWTLAETRVQFLKDRGHPVPSKRALEEELGGKLEEFGIRRERLRDYPKKFSGGELQRISIFRALLRESDLLILDEATSMLDVLVQAKVMRFLLEIREKYDLTYLVISHDTALMRKICQRIYTVKDGTVEEGEIAKC